MGASSRAPGEPGGEPYRIARCAISLSSGVTSVPPGT